MSKGKRSQEEIRIDGHATFEFQVCMFLNILQIVFTILYVYSRDVDTSSETTSNLTSHISLLQNHVVLNG